MLTDLPVAALSLAGFVLAHAAWSLSDLEDGELLSPLAVVAQPDGVRKVLRFAENTQEAAIIAGKTAMREASSGAAAWAFAREGAWRKMEAAQQGDVLAIDFWATGMPGAATFMQPFNRADRGSRFRICGVPTLLVDSVVLAADVAAPSVKTIMAGVKSHMMVADLWATWQ